MVLRKDTDWYRQMLLRYKTDEMISAIMRANSNKSRRNQTGRGGFNVMTPEQLQEVAKKGVLARGHQWHGQRDEEDQQQPEGV